MVDSLGDCQSVHSNWFPSGGGKYQHKDSLRNQTNTFPVPHLLYIVRPSGFQTMVDVMATPVKQLGKLDITNKLCRLSPPKI